MIRLGTIGLVLSLGCSGPQTAADASLITSRAERTGWEQTTGYGEVMFLMQRVAGLSPRAHATTFGSTVEGRPLPLLIVGDVANASPAAVLAAATGVLRVRVVAPEPITAVDLIRSGVSLRIPVEGESEWALEREIPALGPDEYHYVRVITADQGAAWSSPIFAR